MKTKLILTVAALAVMTSNVFGAEIPIKNGNNADLQYLLNIKERSCDLTNDKFKFTGGYYDGKFTEAFSTIWKYGTLEKNEGGYTSLRFNDGDKNSAILFFTANKETCENLLSKYVSTYGSAK